MRKIKAEDIIFKGDFNVVHGTDGDYYLVEYRNLAQIIDTIFKSINKINGQIKELSQKIDLERLGSRNE